VMMSWAPRTLRRCPRWLRNSAGLSLADPGAAAAERLWDGCSSCSKPAVTASLLRFAQGESRDGEVRGGRQPPAVPMQSAPRPDCTTLLVLLKGGSLLQTVASGSRSADSAVGEMPYWSAERGSDATLIGRWGVFETGALIPRADGGSIRRERSSVRWTAGSSVAGGGRGFRAAGWRSSFVATMTLAQ